MQDTNSFLAPDHQKNPDIVRVILDRVSVLVPADQMPQLVELEQQVRTQYGGLRVRIPKKKKYMTQQQRDRAISIALSDTTSTNEGLIRESGISRSHWYELVKRRSGKPG